MKFWVPDNKRSRGVVLDDGQDVGGSACASLIQAISFISKPYTKLFLLVPLQRIVPMSLRFLEGNAHNLQGGGLGFQC